MWYNKLGQTLTFSMDSNAGVELSQYRFDKDGWNPYDDVYDPNQIATTTPPASASSATNSGGTSSGSNSGWLHDLFGLAGTAGNVLISQNQKDTALAQNQALYGTGGVRPYTTATQPTSTGKTGLIIGISVVVVAAIVITVVALKSSKPAAAAVSVK